VENAFGSGRPFSLGVEEELFLVDPFTGRQANSSAAVMERLERDDAARGEIAQELHACEVEMISEPCADAGEAIEMLRALRCEVLATGAGLIAAGTHPSATEGEAEITDKDRYERIRELLGDAAATPVAGLHVHVGMPDADTAIRVFNGLRRHLPLLQALAANSPYRHGRDTGLASARMVTMRSWPRSGVPRAMRDFEDFCATAELLSRAADAPDYTWFWWQLRPHPRLGTVEIRALDVQTTPEDTAALVALIHCLARDAAETADAGDPPAELVEEGLFRAARYGVTAQLPDTEGHLRPLADLLTAALVSARSHAAELGCEEELALLSNLVRRGGGAGRQRSLHEIAGMDTLLRELTRETAASAQP
jgi:glutamate---cysteine ligase / carboxylate-amine ligase